MRSGLGEASHRQYRRANTRGWEIGVDFGRRGHAHAHLVNVLEGRRHEHVLASHHYLAQHNTTCLLSQAQALATVGLPSLPSAQGRVLWSSVGATFEFADPGGDSDGTH